ncbi:MAG: hypothetical protein ACR2QL_02310 [Woeseiaceae bacterium]
MKTRYLENGLALVGALLVLVAVGFAANAALTSQADLEFLATNHTSTLIAGS